MRHVAEEGSIGIEDLDGRGVEHDVQSLAGEACADIDLGVSDMDPTAARDPPPIMRRAGPDLPVRRRAVLIAAATADAISGVGGPGTAFGRA